MLKGKTYIKASTAEQALSLAKENTDLFRYLAGGTDVMVNRFQGNDTAGVLVDISGITALKEVLVSNENLVIGSLISLDDLAGHSAVCDHFPALAEAVKSVASPTIRKTATLGGNLLCENRCSYYNQSEWWREASGYCLKSSGPVCLASGGSKHCFAKFVSDTAVALISLNACVELLDFSGTSIKPLESIYTGDGMVPRGISPEAIITAIRIPLNHDIRSVYKKLRKRATLDFTSLTTAVSVNKAGDVRIVLGGVHAKPVIVDGKAGDDLKALAAEAVSQSRIVDNDTCSRKYRKDMITVFLERSFKDLQLV
ncbi:MAG: FAD binding domain-containing protein [Bacteroidota bacterium]|jgi:4-hydroxybenzoyl-CoA reductase subunit beta